MDGSFLSRRVAAFPSLRGPERGEIVLSGSVRAVGKPGIVAGAVMGVLPDALVAPADDRAEDVAQPGAAVTTGKVRSRRQARLPGLCFDPDCAQGPGRGWTAAPIGQPYGADPPTRQAVGQ
jgi:hypothetical protein